MTKQFRSWKDHWPQDRPRSKASKKGSRVFKVRLNVAGYDDGGVWHGRTETPLYCLRTATEERFVRASSRDEAAKLFGVTDLARKS